MTKVTGPQKKTEKERMTLGWTIPAATAKAHKLNHTDNLDWLK